MTSYHLGMEVSGGELEGSAGKVRRRERRMRREPFILSEKGRVCAVSSVNSKNSGDMVLKHKVSLAAVSSGSEVGDTGRDMGT